MVLTLKQLNLVLNVDYYLVEYYPHPLYTVHMYRDHLVSQDTEAIINWDCVFLVQLSPGLFPLLILSLRTGNMAVQWPASNFLVIHPVKILTGRAY